MNVLDLFSGIGGFSLGLERAGFKTVAFAEIDEWCQRVLAKHWPNVPQLGDVTKLGFEPMSCAGVSHAKTLVTQAEAPALPRPAPVSGGGYAEPFAWYDRSTHLWRTWQRSLTEGWTPFLGTWPRSGMTRSGIAYQLPPLVPLTYGTGFGSLPSHSIPTPTAQDHIERRSTSKETLNPLTNKSVSLDRWVRFWPTAVGSVAQLGEGPATWLARRERIKAKGINGDGMGMPLTIAVQMWPTPTANEDACGTPNGKMQKMLGNHPDIRSQGPGTLNPTWVEWLMGFPLGWTALEPSETPSSRRSSKRSAKPS